MADAHVKEHDYHLVNPSPWPIVGAVGGLTLTAGLVMYFITKKAGNPELWWILPGLFIVIVTMFGWALMAFSMTLSLLLSGWLAWQTIGGQFAL